MPNWLAYIRLRFNEIRADAYERRAESLLQKSKLLRAICAKAAQRLGLSE